MTQSRLVLASSSPTRLSVLRQAGLDVSPAAPRVDEDALRAALEADGATPRTIADALAEAKAMKVGARHPASLVLGCDQTLDLDGICLTKPADLAAARTQLQQLRGRPHKLFSAAVIAEGGRPVWRHTETVTLSVRPFSDAWLDAYLDRNWPAVAGSVGGYHVEGEGVQLFEHINGDWFAILGLPLVQIVTYLMDRGELAK